MKRRFFLLLGIFFLAGSCRGPSGSEESTEPGFPQLSGIYPHLAFYNGEDECGTGAVVPWAGRLWAITYGPHLPNGSSDKLYEITPALERIVRSESVGGTPANRMIHRESGQLFIGPYAIGSQRQVRVIPYDRMPGRHTGNARHLTDPENKLYYATMEEGFYEVDVHTLEVHTLYEDGNGREAGPTDLLPGAHGKGLYSGQGGLVYSNNGEASPEARRKFDIEAGVLAEWDGEQWTTVRRNQFVEVTGPGGIYGNSNPATDPIWATGWDHKSVVLGVRDNDHWSFYRLPKASHSYDGAHGWNTEWPRIRDVGTPEQPDYLMTMHGMFWRFPKTFSSSKSAGIRPRSAYLKVIGDFARWNDRLVFGCDDSARKEFLNTRTIKGDIGGPGQSNSNLWFTSPELPDQLGPTTAEGAVWLREDVKAGASSEPFLFAGWPLRSCWIFNESDQPVNLTFEVDRQGDGNWERLQTAPVKAGQTQQIAFPADAPGEWIRLRPHEDGRLTAHFYYAGEEPRSTMPGPSFRGLARVENDRATGGLLYGLGDNRRTLGLAAVQFDGAEVIPKGYYELNEKLELRRKEDTEREQYIRQKLAIPENVITIDSASVLIVDDRERRWRLPLGAEAFTGLTDAGMLRIAREVATERDLLHCHGAFYELPAENADGFAKLRPVSSHPFRIHDYASYRGLLLMTGVDPAAGEDNPHIIVSDDGKAAVWAGVIDDIWKMGKPTGRGGPWKNTPIEAGEASDPYLIGFYDERSLSLSHDAEEPVTFRIEVEPVGHGPWMTYREVTLAPGEIFEYAFPGSFQARWIRFRADRATRATAWLVYR